MPIRYKEIAGRRVHIVKAELALGRRLPCGAVVHHVDGDKWNNANANLVICQDVAYHALLHRRTRIVKAGGDPNRQRICCHCRRVLDTSCFSVRATKVGRRDGYKNQCRGCMSKRAGEYYERRGRALAGYVKRGQPRQHVESNSVL
jgi:hypothetical protein